MVVDSHHVACVSQFENPNLQKKFFFLKIGIFFSKLGKKSPKFHWEWGRKFWTPKTPKKDSADPDEMPHFAAFQLGLHCLPQYLFRSFQYTKDEVIYMRLIYKL